MYHQNLAGYPGLGEAELTPPAQQQIYEEPCAIPYNVTLTANQELTSQGVNIDTDGDFQLEAITGIQTGTYQVRFRLPSGRWFPSSYARNANLIGTGAFMLPVVPAPIFPSGSKLTLDIKDLSGAGNTVQIVFYGRKLMRVRG